MKRSLKMDKRRFGVVQILLISLMISIVHLTSSPGHASLRSGYNGEAEFNAWETGVTEISFPFVNSKSEWKWQTEIVVQNIGTSSNTVSLNYYDFWGSLVGNLSTQLLPNASQVFSPPTNFSGSLVVSGTQPLTAIVIGSNPDPTWSGDKLFSYEAAKIIPSVNYIQLFPIQKNYNGWNSILAVQNQEGSGPASITLTFRDISNGLTTAMTDTLPAYSSKFYDASTLTSLGNSFKGSVYIQANKTVTGMVISSSPISGGGALAYSPIWWDSNPLSSKILSSTIASGFVRVVSESSFTIHNPSTMTGTCIIQFYDMNGVSYDSSVFEVPPRGYYIYPGSGFIPIGILGSARIESDQPVVAIISTDWSNPPLTSTGYNAVVTRPPRPLFRLSAKKIWIRLPGLGSKMSE